MRHSIVRVRSTKSDVTGEPAPTATETDTTCHNIPSPGASPLMGAELPPAKRFKLHVSTNDLLIPPHMTPANKVSGPQLSTFPRCPVSPPPPVMLQRPSYMHAFSSKNPSEAHTYDLVRAVGLPNYRGARIPVIHGLRIDQWRAHEHLIPDKSLVDMLEFGFPAGFTGDTHPAVNLVNHSSATRQPRHVKKYIDTEIAHNALIGPFDVPPFQPWTRINPLMTRPKKDSDDMRVILDLSFPDGCSVNSSIPGNELDGADFKLRLPTPKLLADKMRELGPGCLLYKVDLSRAYRQLRSDPLDWPLLGIQWEGQTYIDTAIPFGLRHGASACQRTSEAANQIAASLYEAWSLAYIDDTAGASLPGSANRHYSGLRQTFDDLGLDTAHAKCQAPSTQMDWIGVTYDSVEMSMRIAIDKVMEARAMCSHFLTLETTNKRQMQRLMGKVLHATKCTDAARRFTARLLDLLALTHWHQTVFIPHEAKMDAMWLEAFLQVFNGLTLIKPTTAQHVAYVDACPLGIGGLCPGTSYYTAPLPTYVTRYQFTIAAIECFNVLVALRVWANEWSHAVILIYCDNWATVCAVNSGRAQDLLIRSAIREMWWLCATKDIELVVRHRPGAQMEEADTLSLASSSARQAERFRSLKEQSPDRQTEITDVLLRPPLFL